MTAELKVQHCSTTFCNLCFIKYTYLLICLFIQAAMHIHNDISFMHRNCFHVWRSNVKLFLAICGIHATNVNVSTWQAVKSECLDAKARLEARDRELGELRADYGRVERLCEEMGGELGVMERRDQVSDWMINFVWRDCPCFPVYSLHSFMQAKVAAYNHALCKNKKRNMI